MRRGSPLFAWEQQQLKAGAAELQQGQRSFLSPSNHRYRATATTTGSLQLANPSFAEQAAAAAGAAAAEPAPTKMSSKKKKRMEAFIKRKLKKDDRVKLIASLA